MESWKVKEEDKKKAEVVCILIKKENILYLKDYCLTGKTIKRV